MRSRRPTYAEQPEHARLLLDAGGEALGGFLKRVDAEAGQDEHNIRDFAYNTGVSLDKQTIKNQAQLIGRGMATEQDFKSQVVNQAASLYPSYRAQLEAGQTMMDIASPYVQSMAEDLDVPVASIKLTDPLIKRALNGVDQKGKPTGMDQVTFQQQLRSDPRWGKTKTAQDTVMTVGLRVLKDMGLRSEGE